MIHSSKIDFFDIDGTPLSDSLLNEPRKLIEELCAYVKQYSANEDVSVFDVLRDKYEKI